MENVVNGVRGDNRQSISDSMGNGAKNKSILCRKEYSIMNLAIQFDPSVSRSKVEGKVRSMMEVMGIILEDLISVPHRETSMNVHFASNMGIPDVARALLELEGVEEVTVETPDDHKDHRSTGIGRGRPFSPLLSQSDLTFGTVSSTSTKEVVLKHRQVNTAIDDIYIDGSGQEERHQETLATEYDTVRMGRIFDSVQSLFDVVVAQGGAEVHLHMIGDQVEVRKGTEDALTALIVHMVRHIIGEGPIEDRNGKTSEEIDHDVTISAYNGCTRATVNVLRTVMRTSPRSTERPSVMGIHTKGVHYLTEPSDLSCSDANVSPSSIDLSMAKHMAKGRGWDMSIERVPTHGTSFSLKLGPDRGVMVAMVVQIDDSFYAIDLDRVHCGVLVDPEEIKTGSIRWRGIELPLMDLRGPAEGPVSSQVKRAEGLVVDLGSGKACLLLSKLVSVQEFAPDISNGIDRTSHGNWGSLSSGLRVMIIDPNKIPQYEQN